MSADEEKGTVKEKGPEAEAPPEEKQAVDPAAAEAALAAFESGEDNSGGERKGNGDAERESEGKDGSAGKPSFWARWFERPRERAQEKIREAGARPDDEDPPVVLFENVTKTYANGFTAVRDVDFVVDNIPGKGEFISLLGPSGCGKSTILRMIAGLDPQHPPSEGRVRVLGKKVEGPGADRGMVFQSYTSFDNRTVLENVAFGLECRGVGREERRVRSQEMIGKVGLSIRNDSDKYPHQLSGGMQQRVAIARTLILKPRIILMDEPFGALDPITRMHMQDLLISLWREVQATVFFITHSIEEAVYLGDRVYLMSNSPGTILEEVEVPPPDEPAMKMQRDPDFQQVVFRLRDMIDRLEREQKEGKSRAEAKE